MARRLATRCVRLIPVMMCAALVASCGGDATTGVDIPPPTPSGPTVSGTVLAPNGQLSQLPHSLIDRFASLVVDAANALTANVSPVPRTTVTLQQVGGQPLHITQTDDGGGYKFVLDPGQNEGACPPLQVFVGSGSTMMMALVCSTNLPTDIDSISTAVATLIIQAGNICTFTPTEVCNLMRIARQIPDSLTCTNVAQCNADALAIIATDPTWRAAFNTARGTPAPTDTPTPTTPTPTRTFTVSTPVASNTPSPTLTRVPTSTPTVSTPPANTPTRTPVSTSTFTQTSGPTRTNTPVSTNTPVPTNTNTPPPPPTNTSPPPPTNTSPPPPTNTSPPPPTNTSPPPPTNTSAPVATFTPSPTQGPTGSTVNVGAATGSPGGSVDVGVTLTSAGAQIQATSNDITYDSSQVDVDLVGGNTPNCTVNPAIGPGTTPAKQLLLSVLPGTGTQKTLRVGVINFDNVVLIPDGALFTCKFNIAANAALGSVPLNNLPGAADPTGADLTVMGANGAITVQAAGAAVNVGNATGATGATVQVPVSLANSGGQIQATSNDIQYDSTQVDVVLQSDNMTPDCTVNSALNKMGLLSVLPGAGSAKVLRVGVINFDNVAPIADGPVFSCNFKIAAGATAGAKSLGNVPGAANATGDDLSVGGTSGTITVQ